MFKKVIIATVIASVVGLVVFYLVADLLGTQILLKDYYLGQKGLLRHHNLLSHDTGRILKYFCVFLVTNAVWSYVFYMRQSAFQGSALEKGIKFFFLLWLLTIPVHLWSWVFISYSKRILVYNIFVYYLLLFLSSGAVIGKVCSENE